MTDPRRRGYIFVETLVAMGILSVSAVVIQESVRQAILARAEAKAGKVTEESMWRMN